MSVILVVVSDPTLSCGSLLCLGGWGEGPSSHFPPRDPPRFSWEFPAGKRSCLLRRLPLRKEREDGEGGPPAIDPNDGGPRVLTIYTNNPGENLVQKHKTIRFDVVAQSIPNSALQSRKMDSPQITAQFSTEMREPMDFPTEISLPACRRPHAGKNFPVFSCKL